MVKITIEGPTKIGIQAIANYLAYELDETTVTINDEIVTPYQLQRSDIFRELEYYMRQHQIAIQLKETKKPVKHWWQFWKL